MADFEARVVGRLDTQELESRLAALASANHHITITPNTRSVDTALNNIENRIRRISNMNLNLNPGRGIGGGGGRGGGNRNGIDNITQEYTRLLNITRQIGNIEVKIRGLDTNQNSRQIATLQRQLADLHSEYQTFYQLISQDMNANQFDGLRNAMTDTQRRLDELGGKMADAKQKMADDISAQIDSGKIQSDISSIASQYDKLSVTGHQSLSSIRADLQELKLLQGELSNPQQYRNNDQIIQTYEQYNKVLERVRNTIKTVSSESNGMATSLQATQLKNQMSSWLSSNSKAAANYGASIQGLIARVDQLNSSGLLTKKEAQDIKEQFIELKMQATAAGEVGRSFGDSLKNSFKSILGVVDVTQVLRQAIRYFKEMAQEVIKVDTAMTQFKIVTKGSADDYRQFYQNSVNTAKQIGGSVTDLIDSSTTYARLGYSMGESEMLAKYTSMLQNVGDIDASSAQDAITSITKAFEINATDIETTMDKMVEVGNNFPISVAQIAEGMTNAGSMLNSAGNSFEQSIALLTAANTTVQNISKSSTGLRTLAARLRNTKTELDDLGESLTDAEYENIVSALTGKGVSLKDANGEFRSTYDIIKDIAKVWDTMSSMDQAALAKTLAGTRQQNVFFGLVTQFKEAEGAMAAMQDSSGALTSAYENVLDSVQGKINQFKASWTALANTVLSSDFLKGAVDTGTAFINVLDKITGFLGPLPTLIGGVAAALSFGKNPLGELINQFLSRLYLWIEYAQEVSNGNMNEVAL